ncbi:MAG: hypothetical protein C4309_14245 [Chloroflexota bacterium]|mgnify:CR=1 FL=1
MRKIKLFSVLALVIVTTLLMTSVVYAYALITATGLNNRTGAIGGGTTVPTLTGMSTIFGLSQGPTRYVRVTITSPGRNIVSNKRLTIQVREPLVTV